MQSLSIPMITAQRTREASNEKKKRIKKERKKEEKKMAIKPSILYVNVWERDESQRRTLRSVEYLKLRSRFCTRACLSISLFNQ